MLLKKMSLAYQLVVSVYFMSKKTPSSVVFIRLCVLKPTVYK